MSFASFTQDPQPSSPQEGIAEDVQIEQQWWPSVSLSNAREVVRIHGTVSDARLLDALSAAVISVNRELSGWRASFEMHHPDGPGTEKSFLYLRAVHFHAKAELIERYRDFDSAADGDRRADATIDLAEDARRVERWSIRELVGKPRLTVELM